MSADNEPWLRKTLDDAKLSRAQRGRSFVASVRPRDASIEGIRKCISWIDACCELGWAEEVLPDIEALFWKYHDKDGHKMPNTTVSGGDEP